MVSSGHLTFHREPTHTILQIKYKKNNLTTIHSRLRAKAQLDLVDISWSDGLSEFYNADTNCPMTGNFKTEVPNGSTIDENNLQCQKSPSNDQVPDLHRTQNYRRSLLFPVHIPSNQNTLIQFKINTPHRTLSRYQFNSKQLPKYIR